MEQIRTILNQNSEEIWNKKSLTTSKKEVTLADKKNAINVLETYSPSHLVHYCSFEERCFIGTAPTVFSVKKHYGDKIIEAWFKLYLVMIAETTSCEPPTTEQVRNESMILISNFGHLKLTEFMIFFLKFMSGEYGKFYGKVDFMVLNSAMKDFLKYRNLKLESYERKSNMEAIMQYHEDCRNGINITRAQFEEWKKKNEDVKNAKAI